MEIQHINWAPWGALIVGLGTSGLLYYNGVSEHSLMLVWAGFALGCLWVVWGVFDSGWFRR
jgi:hypothetical protein